MEDFNFKVGDKVTREGWNDTCYVTITAVGGEFFLGKYKEVETTYRSTPRENPWVRWVSPFPFKTGEWVGHKYRSDGPIQVGEFRREEGYWAFTSTCNPTFAHAVHDSRPDDWFKVDPPKTTTKRFLVETEEKPPTRDDNFFSIAKWGPYEGKIIFNYDLPNNIRPSVVDEKRDVIVKITELDD